MAYKPRQGSHSTPAGRPGSPVTTGRGGHTVNPTTLTLHLAGHVTDPVGLPHGASVSHPTPDRSEAGAGTASSAAGASVGLLDRLTETGRGARRDWEGGLQEWGGRLVGVGELAGIGVLKQQDSMGISSTRFSRVSSRKAETSTPTHFHKPAPRATPIKDELTPPAKA